MDEMTLLQILQSLREHFLRTVRHKPSNFVETHHTRLAPVQEKQYEQRPFVAETTDNMPDGAS